jgi:hypothetical protein
LLRVNRRNWSGPVSAQMHFDLFLRGADVLFNYMRTSVELEIPFLDFPA